MLFRLVGSQRFPRRLVWSALTSSLLAVTSIAIGGESIAAKDSAAKPEARLGSDLGSLNGFHGAYQDSIEIDVPEFPGVEPAISLGYSSSGGNGFVGVGWSLNGFSAIERASPGRGSPKYDASDIFLLDGEELVPCASGSVSPSCLTGGTHSRKRESYERIQRIAATDQWIIWSADGAKTTYNAIYGTWSGPYQWGVSTVVDTKGNTTNYSWATNKFACCWVYPDSVSYGGHSVKFHWESRSDVERLANGLDLQKIHGRIKTIEVTTGSSRVRAYKLSYGTTSTTHRSILSSVQEFGRDATLDATGTVTGGTAEPAETFTYQAGAHGLSSGVWTTDTPAHMRNGGSNAVYNVLSGDFNGDGKSDIATVSPDSGGAWANWYAVDLSNGNGFNSTVWTSATPQDMRNGGSANSYVPLTGDFNGDGKTDIATISKNGGGAWGLWIKLDMSTGSGFSTGWWESTTPEDLRSGDNTRRYFHFVGDYNGDGKSDILTVSPDGGGNWGSRFKLDLSTGNGFNSVWWTTQSAVDMRNGGSANAYNILPGDYNGDGKQDVAIVSRNGGGAWGSYIKVDLSTGNGFADAWWPSATPVEMRNGGSGSSYRCYAIDVNGDGKTDIASISPNAGAGWNSWIAVDLSYGTNFVHEKWSSPTPQHMRNGYSTSSYETHPGDYNGDGKTDLLTISKNAAGGWADWVSVDLAGFGGFVTGSWSVDTPAHMRNGGTSATYDVSADDFTGDGRTDLVTISPNGGSAWANWMAIEQPLGAVPDLLTVVRNGRGAESTVEYTPSSAWSNTNNPPIVQTVTKVTTSDGRGGSASSTVSYSGGLYDRVEKRSLGFRYVKETDPAIAGEAAGPYRETWYKQDYGSESKPEEAKEWSGSGKLLASTKHEYTTNGATIPYTSLETGVWSYEYDGSGNTCASFPCAYGARSYVSHTHNAYGHVVQSVTYGDYDVSGDEKTLTTQFVPNTTAYIVSLPAVSRTYNGAGTSGTLITEALTYYDGATSWNTAPSAGLLTREDAWLNTTNSYVSTLHEYDAWGNETAEVDPLGKRSTTEYDTTYHAFVTREVNALGHATSNAWDAVCGAITSSTNPDGAVTTTTYDALCRPLRKDFPGGDFEITTYGPDGNANDQWTLVETPGPAGAGNHWVKTYEDGLGRAWRTITRGPSSSQNIYDETSYDARGNVVRDTEPFYWDGVSAVTTYATTKTFDALDRVTAITTPDGKMTSIAYGVNKQTFTSSGGKVTVDTLDFDDHLLTHTETLNGVASTVTSAYDVRGNLTRITDPKGNVSTYVWDSLGRKVSLNDPNLGSWAYQYDANGNKTSETSPTGERTEWTYDALGRPVSKTARAGTTSSATVYWKYDEVRAGYSNIGEVTTITDASGVQLANYDAAGRLVQTTRTIDGSSYAFQYRYDADGRLLGTTYPDGDVIGSTTSPLTHDAAGRLYSIPGIVTSIVYDASGRETAITNANGVLTRKTYAASSGLLTRIEVLKGTTVLQDMSFTRNADNDIVTRTNSCPTCGSDKWTYGYDDLGQLTSATNTVNAARSETYAVDAIGNITSKTGVGAYTYPAAGAARPHAVTAAGGNTYLYDAAGRMISGAGRTIEYDGDGRPSSINGITFAYDANGVRLKKASGATWVHYIADDYEVQSDGTITKYLSAAGELVAKRVGSGAAATTSWLHTDHLGTLQVVTNGTGAEIQRMSYEPWGEQLPPSSGHEESRGFTGQRQDETGLVYLHARYYDPALGRFISPDPTVPTAETIGLNRYVYATNDPINNTDIDGYGYVKQHNVSKIVRFAWRAAWHTAAQRHPKVAAYAKTYVKNTKTALRWAKNAVLGVGGLVVGWNNAPKGRAAEKKYADLIATAPKGSLRGSNKTATKPTILRGKAKNEFGQRSKEKKGKFYNKLTKNVPFMHSASLVHDAIDDRQKGWKAKIDPNGFATMGYAFRLSVNAYVSMKTRHYAKKVGKAIRTYVTKPRHYRSYPQYRSYGYRYGLRRYR